MRGFKSLLALLSGGALFGSFLHNFLCDLLRGLGLLDNLADLLGGLGLLCLGDLSGLFAFRSSCCFGHFNSFLFLLINKSIFPIYIAPLTIKTSL